MNARPTRVLLLFQSPELRSHVLGAVESTGLTGLVCGSDSQLFESIEATRPKLVCLQFDGRFDEDVARFRLLADLYPRLSILLFQAQAEATPPPQEWLEFTAGHIGYGTSGDQLAREISWCLCLDPAKPQRTPSDAPFFVGRSQAMLQVFDAIHRLADCPDPILIQGEHGTGKQLAAIEMHSRWTRHEQSTHHGLAIHTLECEEFEELELERLLFGPANHSAFPPMLQDPQIGTVVLSELAAISPALQSRLIAWLRLNKSRDSMPKIIFTTSRDLGRLVADRKVRADLFLELSNQVIGLPPLRHRPNDLRMLTEHFVQRINQYRHSLRQPSLSLEPRHYQALENYHWPGNVRELRAAVMSLAFNSGPFDPLTKGGSHLDHKQSFSRKLSSLFNLAPTSTDSNFPSAGTDISLAKAQRHAVVIDTTEPSASSSPDQQYWALIVERFAADKSPNIYARALDLFERELIKQVLDRTGGDLEEAAKLLGLTNISLQKKMQHHDIELPNPCTLE